VSETSLEAIFGELEDKFRDTTSLVRVVLSGRRRNMQTAHERIDMRPVEIKGEIQVQVSHSDGRQMTTKNYSPAQAPFSELIRKPAHYKEG
jgi:translation initiation factor 2 alpha subunit (eIF-2alpha)